MYLKDPVGYNVSFQFMLATMDFFTTELTEPTERRENDTLTGEIIGAIKRQLLLPPDDNYLCQFRHAL